MTDLDQLKARNPIADVVQHYGVQLHRSGRKSQEYHGGLTAMSPRSRDVYTMKSRLHHILRVRTARQPGQGMSCCALLLAAHAHRYRHTRNR